MAFENTSEQHRPSEAQTAPQRLAWQPSASEYQMYSNNSVQQRNDANRLMIQGGVLNDVSIDFGGDQLLAQAVHYRDYPTTQPQEKAQSTIFQEPYGAQDKLITGESNQPHVTPGVSTFEDANHLVSGMAEQGLKLTNDLVTYLSKPQAVNESITSLGPVLDTAVNYYGNPAKVSHIQHDTTEFANAGLAQVEHATEHYSFPMDHKQIGHETAEMAPWFIPGLKKPVTKATALESGGLTIEEAAKLSKSELIEKLGAGGVEWTGNKYRDVFFQAHPELMSFEDQIVVHHAIEQQVLEEYPGLFSAKELNDITNLRGIPKDIDDVFHKSILRKDWDDFYIKNPMGSQSNAVLRGRIIEHAKQLDSKYANKFEPPIQ